MIAHMHMPSLVAAVAASMVIGALWYSPFAFGKQWMAAAGITAVGREGGNPGKLLLLQLLLSFVIAFILQSELRTTTADTLLEGVRVVLPLWLLSSIIYVIHTMYEGRSWKLMALSAAHELVSFSAMAGILAVWR